jgi:2-polyprenyl-3-methyl-5-hydroxy-6-metoxy-1,4-benzoquinol methylase
MSQAEWYYKEPDKILFDRRMIEYKKKIIEPFFPENRKIKVLDVACGFGMFLEAARRSGYENCEGQDISETATLYAKNKLHLNVTKSDLEIFLKSRQPESYDVITAINIIEHIKKDKIQEVLRLIESRLKNGGTFIMEAPNALSPLGLATFYSDYTHEWPFTPVLIRSSFDDVGFKGIEIVPSFINSNPLIRLGQKILSKITGLDDKLMWSGSLVAIGKKPEN